MRHDSFENLDTLEIGRKTIEFRSLPRLAAQAVPGWDPATDAV